VDKKENRMTLKIMWNMDPMGLSVSTQGTSIDNAWEINEWLLDT